MLAGFYLGAQMAIAGEITLGTYLAYAGLVIQLIWPIRGLGRLVAQMSTGFVSMERIGHIVRQEREPLEAGKINTAERLQGEVIFDGVSFIYETPAPAAQRAMGIATAENGPQTADNGQPSTHHAPRTTHHDSDYVLRDINLRVKPGMVVGLLGATGSGKTSLVNLLPRFYDYS